MVKLVGVVMNFRVNIKHVQIDVEDGTGLVRAILWKEQKECMAQRQMMCVDLLTDGESLCHDAVSTHRPVLSPHLEVALNKIKFLVT
jgi:hypothetical protein